MTILRWFLSHLVLLIVVGTLVFAWLRWDDLQGWVPEPVNRVVMQLRHRIDAVTHSEEATATASRPETTGQPAEPERLAAMPEAGTSAAGAAGVAQATQQESNEPTATETAGMPGAEGVNAPGPKAAPATQPEAGSPERMAASEPTGTAGTGGQPMAAGETAPGSEATEAMAGQAEPRQAAGPETPAAEEAATQFASRADRAETAAQASPAEAAAGPATGPAAAGAGADRAGFMALLGKAREAFWRRDLRTAIETYRELTRLAPEDADVWGEYGNVLFAANDMPAAAEAYAQAAERLIAAGRREEVTALLPIIQRFYPARAQALQQKLQASASRG